jgi:hypothetical protein
MAHPKDPAAVKAERENLLHGAAIQFLERAFSPEGMPSRTKFADLKERAVPLGQAVSQNRIDQALAPQAAAVPAEAETGSGCGGPVEPTDATEPRAVITQVGRARGDEPRRSCPKGRAAVLPSVPALGP